VKTAWSMCNGSRPGPFFVRPKLYDMGMRRNNPPQFSPAYEARIAEEETKLRWLIARHSGSRELAYYLIFLLLANEQLRRRLWNAGEFSKPTLAMWWPNCGKN
jgi:hypothetical protein